MLFFFEPPAGNVELITFDISRLANAYKLLTPGLENDALDKVFDKRSSVIGIILLVLDGHCEGSDVIVQSLFGGVYVARHIHLER